MLECNIHFSQLICVWDSTDTRPSSVKIYNILGKNAVRSWHLAMGCKAERHHKQENKESFMNPAAQ